MSRVDGVIANVQLSLLRVHARNACKQIACVAVGQNEDGFVYTMKAKTLVRPTVLMSECLSPDGDTRHT